MERHDMLRAFNVLAPALLIGASVMPPGLALAHTGEGVAGGFAIFHGHAHGIELPTFAYGVGFVIATGCLHLVRIAFGQLAIRPESEEVYLLLVAVIAATLAALYPKGQVVAHVILASSVGLLIGLLSTPDPGPRATTNITLAGSFVGANLTLFCVGGSIGLLHNCCTQHWVEVGLRIAAAWIAAVAVLMGALAFAL